MHFWFMVFSTLDGLSGCNPIISGRECVAATPVTTTSVSDLELCRGASTWDAAEPLLSRLCCSKVCYSSQTSLSPTQQEWGALGRSSAR